MNFTKLVLSKNLPVTSRSLLGCSSISKTISCRKSSKPTSSSSSSSDSDDELKKPPSSGSDAVQKLNFLLEQMMSNDRSKKASLDLARPANKREQGRLEKQRVVTESVEKQVVNAVQDVADSLGGNTKQTESELLVKLLNPIRNDGENAVLSDILKGMKIEREVKPQVSKAEEVRNALSRMSSQRRISDRPASGKRPKRQSIPTGSQGEVQPVTLFGDETLGIFTNPSDLKDSPQLATWQKLYDKELQLAVTHPPANYFQEMILWTNQGKLWQFPINNELGLDEESKVYFTEHIFLEKHLEPWCPPRGPLRHFMELVCVGLSKNSYLTVQAKREHIDWFRNYFEEKRQLLQELGALPGAQIERPSNEKQ